MYACGWILPPPQIEKRSRKFSDAAALKSNNIKPSSGNVITTPFSPSLYNHPLYFAVPLKNKKKKSWLSLSPCPYINIYNFFLFPIANPATKKKKIVWRI